MQITAATIVIIIFALIMGLCFAISIKETYQNLKDKNKFIRGLKAAFLVALEFIFGDHGQ